jgi:hypothetical protein
MRNEQVIERFINGEQKGKSSNNNLYIEGTKLFNYGTLLAQHHNGKIFINITKYSHSTSTIQNKILRATPKNMIVEVKDVLRGHWKDLY